MRLIDRRIGLLFAIFLVLLLSAAARAAWLGGVRGEDLREHAVAQQVDDLTVPARRGTITDRRGTELAVSEEAATVFAYPFLVDRPGRVAERLAPILDLPEDELLATLGDPDVGFAYLARQLDSHVGERVSRLGIEGVETIPEPSRRYPHGELAAQLIGAVGTDGYGLAGLEQSREETLGGDDGRRRIVNDATGKPISIVEEERATPGQDLELTIDGAIQARAEDVLADVGEQYRPRGASALVLDPNTGAVLAMASWPAADAREWPEAGPNARRNGAAMTSYEPGSTFKPFTVAGALEDALIAPDTELRLPPTIRVADRTIHESHTRGTVRLDVSDILARSSNVGTVKIGLRLGEERFDRWVRAFGFGQPTGVGVPGEAPGIVPSADDYSGSSIGNLPIGQGISVTALQMAQGFGAIANDGVMHRPYVVAGEGSEGRRVVSERTSAQVSRMLKGVLGPGGTAPEASIPGYQVAGKTGTAEKAVDGTYSNTKFVASFIGFAPVKDAELLVAVMVDEPHGSYSGGDVAAPAFERIASFALPYLGIAPR